MTVLYVLLAIVIYYVIMTASPWKYRWAVLIKEDQRPAILKSESW